MDMTSMSRLGIANIVRVWRSWINYGVMADPESSVSVSPARSLTQTLDERDILLLTGVDEPIHIG